MSEVGEQYGPYTRVRRLGVGGMAETFLAVQRGAAGFEQRVCMKFILPAYRRNPDFRRLFLREASIAASLRHSNIVGVIDVDDAARYLVLELVDGVDLRTLLSGTPNHRLPPELATLVLIELCKALSYAHGRRRGGEVDGIVHRDVSPSNVLVSYSGEVKLTDFGVARAMRADVEPLSMTVKGKLCYMSPEQARGQLLDGRSDLFSLGIVAYELLSSRRPFDGNTDADTLLRITAGQHAPLLEVAPEIPAGLATVVERLLCRDREQRFGSADDTIDALSRFTPRATAFRLLGQMAQQARPHQTLANHAALAFAPAFEDDNLAMTQTQALPDADGSALDADRSDAELRKATTAPNRSPWQALLHVNRNAWTALAVSVLLLLAVTTAWSARLSNDHADKAPPLSSALPPLPRDTQTNVSITSTGAGIASAGAGKLQLAPTPAPTPTPTPTKDPTRATSEPTRTEPARATTESTPTEPEPTPQDEGASHDREGSLTVGVMPLGFHHVWIDGRDAGWAPIDKHKLAPGWHMVAAGSKEPVVHRRVLVRAAATRRIVLDLEHGAKGAAADAQTTAGPAAR